MKINKQFQEIHTGTQSADWVLKQQVERDICLLYHQLANYSYIMGDLYYGDVFCLPYWEFLEMPGLDLADRDFIRDGCLVMILAMASECIDGTGFYLTPYVDRCAATLDSLGATDGDASRLIATVRAALKLVKQGAPESAELSDACRWVHERYVQRYFSDRADDFRSNP